MTAPMMTDAFHDSGAGVALINVVRTLGYLGFVMLVGASFFITWLWPGGKVLPIFRRIMRYGGALVVLSTLLSPLLLAGDGWGSYGGRVGALALARVALVCVAFAFGRDVLRSARSMRGAVTLWQLCLVLTYVLASDAWGGQWEVVKIVATVAHLFATAAWLGGLLTLAAVLIPSTDLDELHGVLPKFSIVATVSVVALIVSGTLHSLAVAGGLRPLMHSHYGTVLVIKVAVFGTMLILGNIGRKYAEHVGPRKVTDIDESAPPETVQAFAVAIGAEFALALAVLAATAALVEVVPTP